MEAFSVLLAAIIAGLIMVGIFVLGMLFAVRLITDAQDDARYDRLKEEYYRLAGFKNLGDPRPYVPPQSAMITRRKTLRARSLPGMDKLERLLKEGKRGTVMWRAGDSKSAR